MKKCPVCGEVDCAWWQERYEEHELDQEEEELEEEDDLERERRTRG